MAVNAAKSGLTGRESSESSEVDEGAFNYPSASGN